MKKTPQLKFIKNFYFTYKNAGVFCVRILQIKTTIKHSVSNPSKQKDSGNNLI